MSSNLRIAIINKKKCKPKKCHQECRLRCPSVMMGKKCIDIEDTAIIREILCSGCGICVKTCPMNAIKIVNIPNEMKKDMVYTYGKNTFRLYDLPIPQSNKITGIIGKNGIGKTTVLNILRGIIKPNYGYVGDTDIQSILERHRGSVLHKYLEKLYNKVLKIVSKPQNIDGILRNLQKRKSKRTVKEIVNRYIDKNNERHMRIIKLFGLEDIYDNKIVFLSGGEFQLLTCAAIMMQKADVYIFDEPTTYLDIHHRLKIAKLIKEIAENKYVFVVDHDLTILEYVSDHVHIMYGEPGAYGIISSLYSTQRAINNYFSGYSPADNMRFREHQYKFMQNNIEEEEEHDDRYSISYKAADIKYDNFNLHITEGNISSPNIVIIFGKNGTGKTTLLNHLEKELNLVVSYKPQYVDKTKFMSDNKYPIVQEYLYNNYKKAFCSSMFKSDVLDPMNIPALYNKYINHLSGGELQRFMISVCLARDADIYLIDEPSASLDIEQRVLTAQIIKRYVNHNMKICFVVEHDIMMAMYMAMDNIIVFKEGNPNIASAPMSANEGINKFLSDMNITFRTDGTTGRPRINKLNSTKDREQKKSGKYYE